MFVSFYRRDFTLSSGMYLYFLRFWTRWCCLRSKRFRSSYSFYGGVICTPSATLSSCLGLGPAQVPFLVPVVRFWGVHEAEILIQISAHFSIRLTLKG